MSTDFSLHTLLTGSNSSTSVTSPNDSQEPTTCPSQLDAQILSRVPAAAAHAPVSGAKRSKRKREESDDEKENKRDATEPVKKKRVRTAFTSGQLQRLEFTFTQNQYPDMLIRQDLAEELGLPDQKVHVWFQNRRAKLKRLRGQPTAVFPPPVVCPPPVCPPIHQPPRPLKLAQQSTTTPAVYLNHQPPPPQLPQPPRPLSYQSVGVQTQKRFSLSPSPSPIHLRFQVQERRSLSSTPSVSPLSTPNGSPSVFNIIPPPQSSRASAAVYPAPNCNFVLPSRTSPPAGALHLPAVSTNPLSFAGSGQPFAAPFPYYCSPQTSSSATVAPSSSPMYFVDMPPPLSSNNRAGPPFPQVNFYQM